MQGGFSGPMHAMEGPTGHIVGPPVGMLAPLMSYSQPQMMHPANATPPEDDGSVALGTAADGSMPVVKLRGLPFDTEVTEVNRFLVIAYICPISP